MPSRRARTLAQLDRLRAVYGLGAAARKLTVLKAMFRQSLSTAAEVRLFHELLCFWRAYPDSRALLTVVERWLQAFGSRPDLRRLRNDLQNSGIVGTDIVYPFGAPTARWLEQHWSDRLTIDWHSVEHQPRLERAVLLWVLPAEVPGLDETPLPLRRWIDHLRGPHASSGGFSVKRAASVSADPIVREHLFDDLTLPFRLAAGPGTPSRTLARFGASPIVFQRTTLRTRRPDLREEARRPPESIRLVARRDAERLIDLARESMVTRERDLDAFAWADARDVRMVNCGEGLQFACIGVVPERRFLLESVYGFLTLKNGVPIGYALTSALFQSSEIAYNVFETFRAGEAAHVYGRLLATTRALFGSDTFVIYPYQLGDHNDEGLESGSWWFYAKLGFRPRARAILPVVGRELARVTKDPAYRTPIRTLKQLVRHHLYLSLDRRRSDVIGALRFDRIGLAVTGYVTARFGTDRERAAKVCADEAAAQLGVDHWRKLRRGERIAWEHWAPLVAVLPGVARWTSGERRDLAEVIRAKGDRRESAFVPLFDRHERLREAVLALTRR